MSRRVTARVCQFDKLSNELIDQILQEVIADAIHQTCMPQVVTQSRPVWNALKVLPQVSHRFRDLSLRIISIAFCLPFAGDDNRQPLCKISQIMQYLRRVSPSYNESYRSAQTEPVSHEVCVAGVKLGNLEGILKIYWDVAMMSVYADDVLRIPWRQNRDWAAAIIKLTEFVRDALKDADRFYSQIKPLNLAHRALDYLKRYYRMYHCVCMYWLNRQRLQDELDGNGKRRPAEIQKLLEGFLAYEKNLLIAREELPRFVRRAMQMTEFVETLERVEFGPTFGTARQTAKEILIRWRPFVGTRARSKDKDKNPNKFLT